MPCYSLSELAGPMPLRSVIVLAFMISSIGTTLEEAILCKGKLTELEGKHLIH